MAKQNNEHVYTKYYLHSNKTLEKICLPHLMYVFTNCMVIETGTTEQINKKNYLSP